MTAATTDTDATNKAPSHVERNLLCAKCRYNLRTQPWDGACPECGAPVLRSGRAVGFHFSSPTVERRFRCGIGVLAAAMTIEILGVMAATLVHRLVFLIPPAIFWAGVYTWAYAAPLAHAGMLGATVLIAQPLAREPHRFRRRLSVITAVLASGGAAFVAADISSLITHANWFATPWWAAAELCLYLAYAITCLNLFLRIDRRRFAHLWILVLSAVAAQLLVLYGPIVGPILFWTIGSPVVSTFSEDIPSPWRYFVVNLVWWDKHVVATCYTAMFAALLCLLFKLRHTPREPW